MSELCLLIVVIHIANHMQVIIFSLFPHLNYFFLEIWKYIECNCNFFNTFGAQCLFINLFKSLVSYIFLSLIWSSRGKFWALVKRLLHSLDANHVLVNFLIRRSPGTLFGPQSQLNTGFKPLSISPHWTCACWHKKIKKYMNTASTRTKRPMECEYSFSSIDP